MSIIPTLPVCGQPAADRIEIYSPGDGCAHGSLDGSVYTCPQHTAPVRSALAAAGLTPYRVPGTIPRPEQLCGTGYDFVAGKPLTAPDADGVYERDDQETGVPVPPGVDGYRLGGRVPAPRRSTS